MKAMKDTSELMTAKEAAVVLGISDSAVRYACIRGALVGVKIGRAWLISVDSLAEYKDRPRRKRYEQPEH